MYLHLFKCAPAEVFAATPDSRGSNLPTDIAAEVVVADDDYDALMKVREIVATCPPAPEPDWEVLEPREPARPQSDLYDLVPVDSRKPYDVRDIIGTIVDGGEYTEFKENYGTSMVTAFAHIHGHPVGIIGNNGVIFSDDLSGMAAISERYPIEQAALMSINAASGWRRWA